MNVQLPGGNISINQKTEIGNLTNLNRLYNPCLLALPNTICVPLLYTVHDCTVCLLLLYTVKFISCYFMHYSLSPFPLQSTLHCPKISREKRIQQVHKVPSCTFKKNLIGNHSRKMHRIILCIFSMRKSNGCDAML